MSTKKSQTPSKEDLLDELQSIKAFLDDEDSQLADEIPTLTAVAEPFQNEQGSVNHETVLESPEDGEEALLKAYQQEFERDSQERKLAKKAEEIQPEPNDETDKTTSASTEDTEQQSDLKSATRSSLNTNMPKARGENPFLPPHIRERLGKHKEIFEAAQEEFNLQQSPRVEIQGDLLTGFQPVYNLQRDEQTATNSLVDTSSNKTEQAQKFDEPAEETKSSMHAVLDSQKQALIDDLVAEFLPKIEAKLRADLAAKAFKPDD